MRKFHYACIGSLACLLLFGATESAWALQSHGAPEGIYVHQLAHVLFSASLAYLYWHTRRTQDITSNGWKFIRIFCSLLISWNILAFSGHIAYEHLSSSDFINRNTWGEQIAPPISFVKALYYVTKMDHFLMVPALFALVVSLRSFYQEAKKEAQK